MILLNVAVLPKLFSQNVGINSTGAAPDASAMLDVSSTTKGFLMPRMTTINALKKDIQRLKDKKWVSKELIDS